MTAALAAAATLALALPGAAHAQAFSGSRDLTFGTAGQAQTPFGAGAGAMGGLALGSGGSITVAGDVRASDGERTLVARFTPAGVLDPAFAGTGSRLDRFGTGLSPQRGRAVAVAPDGSTIVAGIAGSAIMVARYLPSGGLDGLFGAGGVVLRELAGAAGMPEGSGLAAVALAPNGQLLVAGSSGGPQGEQVVVGRLSDRGVPDAAFGSGGFAVLQLGARSARREAHSQAHALALLPDGRVVIAGAASSTDGSERGFVARLTSAGQLDASFARGGRLFVQLGQASAARRARSGLLALAQRPGGGLLAAGYGTDVAGFSEVVLAGLSADGAPDGAFGRGGVVRSQLGAATLTATPDSVADALAPAPDGSAYVASSGTTIRLGPSGRLDCSYGTLGQGQGFGDSGPNAASGAAVYGAVVQPDGNVLGAGRQINGGVLLGRLIGSGAANPNPDRSTRLRTFDARFAGHGRGVAYGAVLASCGVAKVRFVATPAGGHGRTITTRPQRVSGAYGDQTVCAQLRGLTPRRSYRVRIESVPRGGPVGRTSALRTFVAQGPSRPQEGCG